MNVNHVHTADNAVPPVDDTELGGLLEDLAGFHAGIDLIRDGIRLLALDRHTADRTQTLSAVLAGSTDGTDVLTAIGLLVARLTNPESNPALRELTFEQQKNTQKAGEALVFDLADPDLHQHAADAAGHIHTD
ncbi:hypothetical protein OIA45_48595 (plasmid) [Streptomyces chartreusis]|uniref:hypothetical protein n=1 Tax=Streptomyces chartreusis TaxID=1969 RepID=UPI0037DC9A80|nr:hypothetical protein OIA45_48595 [Streptomyces chartreusis]